MEQLISTPVGDLELTWFVEGLEPALTRTRGGEGDLSEQWSSPGRLEVSIVQTNVRAPSAAGRSPVDGFLAVVWTLDALDRCGPIHIGAHFADPTARQHLNPDTGEVLEAVTYGADGYALSIGTQDDEALQARVGSDTGGHSGPPLPTAWAPLLANPWRGEFGARADALGVGVHLPPLAAGEHADVHIAIAWGPDHDVATWLAVDTNPTEILTAASSGR